MVRKVALGVMLAVVVSVGSRPTASEPVLADVPPAGEGGQPRLGYLEHRGNMYALEDLMDPEYRAASDDDFVRTFDPGAVWAGSGVRNSEDANSIEWEELP